MLDLLKGPIQAIQDFMQLAGQSIANIGRKPLYTTDVLIQMDVIGVGSLPITVLTGLFSGMVMALQMGRALGQYGQTDRTGMVVAIILVRELGPVLTALLVIGRNSSGIASELGSMRVTEQIDAMRALGTDPIKKLVTPRMVATAIMLPCLTVISDFVGMVGGFIVGYFIYHLTPGAYWSSSWRSLEWSDMVQGLLKPFVFSFIVSLVGCYYGLRTTGGTQGVGRATTQAVVTASVLVFVLTFFITKIFVSAT